MVALKDLSHLFLTTPGDNFEGALTERGVRQASALAYHTTGELIGRDSIKGILCADEDVCDTYASLIAEFWKLEEWFVNDELLKKGVIEGVNDLVELYPKECDSLMIISSSEVLNPLVYQAAKLFGRYRGRKKLELGDYEVVHIGLRSATCDILKV